MKNINSFIQEKLLISTNTPKQELNNDERVKEVIELGKEKGLKVVFRNREMPTGDFCFFIYDKRKQDRYLIGYDGYWITDSPYTFDYCLEKAKKYIEEYK